MVKYAFRYFLDLTMCHQMDYTQISLVLIYMYVSILLWNSCDNVQINIQF